MSNSSSEEWTSPRTVTTPKPIKDLSSPSAGCQQRVVFVSPTSSALSDGSFSPPHLPVVASSTSDSNNKAGSQGASSAIAT